MRMPLSFQFAELNDIGSQFLIIDASLGLTFLDLAQTTSDADARTRLISEAHNAYEAIVKHVLAPF